MTFDVVIPARGGSKGFPRKNLALLGGRPLIAWAVTAACSSRAARVIVSTDDEEIAAEAIKAGARIVDRPTTLAGDRAHSEDAVIHALSAGSGAPVVVMVQCTTPGVLAENIDATAQLVLDGAFDSAFTAAPSHQLVWRMARDGLATPLAHSSTALRRRRQDRAALWVENGAAYAMQVDRLRRTRNRFGGAVAVVPMAPERSVEIDAPADLALAEALLTVRRSRAQAA